MAKKKKLSPAEKTALKMKEAILVSLRAIGVTSITYEYSGEGDDGYQNDITVEPAGKAEVEIKLLTVQRDWSQKKNGWETKEVEQELSVHAAAMELGDSLITLAGNDGYENNDGGGGRMELDVKTGKLDYTHYWNEIVQNEGDCISV